MKRFISILLCLTFLLGLNSIVSGARELPFTDVKESNWFFEAVMEVYTKNLMIGRNEEIFAPSENMTRAELVTALSRIAGEDVGKFGASAAGFIDINGNEWFVNYVGWGAKNSILNGYNDGTFRANNSVSRQEMAVLFIRFLRYLGINAKVEDPASEFTDADDISGWAKEDVDELRLTGLVKGDNYGKFNPSSNASRAEIATIIARAAAFIEEHYIDDKKLLANDGTEYTYTYKDSLSPEKFLKWIKSMADPTDIFDSAEIVGDVEFSGVKNIKIAFSFGNKTFERTYSVTFVKGDSDSKNRVLIFVSPDGDDRAKGTKDDPLATLEGAKAAIRNIEKSAPINVYFRRGDYYFSEGVDFSAEDSGTKTAPVTYSAYRDETVNFFGGIKIDPSLITKANSSISSLLLDKTAKEKLMQIDLSKINVELPMFYDFGIPTVYIGETPLETSRWPNANDPNPYTQTFGDVTNNPDGSKTVEIFPPARRRAALWSPKSIENLYMFGYLAYDWTNAYYDASSIDTEKGTVTITGSGYFNDIKSDEKRFYFMNIPEEIDVPGESYIDREKKVIYFYPTDDYRADKTFISTLKDVMINLNDTENIAFENIDIQYICDTGIKAEDTRNLTVSGCTVAHGSQNGMTLDGIGITVSDCHVYDFLTGGISIYGGDRATLTSGESLIENCEIHDINRTEAPYRRALDLYSVGIEVRNCEIYNCKHQAVEIGTNDIKFIYNEIHHCLSNCGDMGAVYYGRNPSILGTVINYNYFHDIGNKLTKDFGQKMIYIDDGSFGAEIHGNVFARTIGDFSSAINNHGSQFSDMRNNIFIDLKCAFSHHGWTINEDGIDDDIQDGWFVDLYDRSGRGHNIVDRLLSVNFDSDLWRNHYKGTIWEKLYDYVDSERIEEYAALSDEELFKIAFENAPSASNVLNENIFINVISHYEMGWGAAVTYENNYEGDTSIFENYENDDFSLIEPALKIIRSVIPGFNDVPFNQMGRID